METNNDTTVTEDTSEIIVHKRTIEYPNKIRKEIKELSKLEPAKFLMGALFDWGIIFLCFLFWHFYGNWYLYLPLVIIVASRQHGLAYLMHDVSHYRMIKNRKWGDRLGNWFLAYPLFITTEGYRKNHIEHHYHLNTDEDPDWTSKIGKPEWEFPKTKWEIYKLLGKMAIGWGLLVNLSSVTRYSSGSKEISDNKFLQRLIHLIIMILLISYFNIWEIFILLWIIPAMTFLAPIRRMRSIAEHFGVEYEHDHNMTRSTECGWLEKFILAPHNSHYHLEHHIYISVPFYNLHKLAILLRKSEEFCNLAHISKSYFGSHETSVINDLSRF